MHDTELDLPAAIDLVVADTRDQEPDRTAGMSDATVVYLVRTDFDHLDDDAFCAEVDGWLEQDVVDEQLAQAYKAVMTASDDEIEDAL